MGYVRRFGLAEADVVVFVLSSCEAAVAEPIHAPAGVHPGYPTRTPLFALTEAIGRYLLPRLRASSSRARASQIEPAREDAAASAQPCLAAMREASVLARQLGATPLFARFLTREEIRTGPDRGFDLIGQVAAETNTPVIDLGPRFAAAIRAGQNPYRTGDDTHPNELGQRLICEAIAPAVLPLLASVPVRGLSFSSAASAAATPAASDQRPPGRQPAVALAS
jgi:hypothetical protein